MAEKKMTFEQNMDRLEEIVHVLERGDESLDQSLALFEEGTSLLKKCTGILDKAEQKIHKLMAGPDGEPVTMPMEKGQNHDM